MPAEVEGGAAPWSLFELPPPPRKARGSGSLPPRRSAAPDGVAIEVPSPDG